MANKKYKVFLDQKVIVWSRQTVFVDAQNKKEAIKLAQERIENEGPDNFEYLSDTESVLTREENNGKPTEEWLAEKN